MSIYVSWNMFSVESQRAIQNEELYDQGMREHRDIDNEW